MDHELPIVLGAPTLQRNNVTTPASDDLRYPIGQFWFDGDTSSAKREERVAQIAEAPGHLRAAVAGLSPIQLDTPYRDGGWTVRQVVHHVPDSHLNAYTRIKLALTEEQPTIRPYEEAKWAELPDARSGPIEPSLDLLDSLHKRWLLLLRQMKAADFERRYRHPEHGRIFTVDEGVALYAWHGQHHTAHITSLRQRMDWK